MAVRLKPRARASSARARSQTARDDRVLYLYAITQEPAGNLDTRSLEAIDGGVDLEAMPCEGYVCWVSRVSKEEFGEGLNEQMQNLDWLAGAGLRHQRVVARISELTLALPARFGTVFLNQASMAEHVHERKHTLQQAFERVKGADEWGVKVFESPKPAKAKTAASSAPKSGREYLKRKAESVRPARGSKLDGDLNKFAARLTALSIASTEGGKASAGQPGLVWHASFLIKRSQRHKLTTLLQEFAAKWQGTRRIDWSGPWPPYSFVGDHVD